MTTGEIVRVELDWFVRADSSFVPVSYASAPMTVDVSVPAGYRLGDAGAGFGAGASGTVFGARGATTGLSRMTAIFAAIFMINSLCLTYLFQRDARATPTSLLDKVPVDNTAPVTAPAQPAPAPIDPNAVPVPAAPAEQPAPKQ